MIYSVFRNVSNTVVRTLHPNATHFPVSFSAEKWFYSLPPPEKNTSVLMLINVPHIHNKEDWLFTCEHDAVVCAIRRLPPLTATEERMNMWANQTPYRTVVELELVFAESEKEKNIVN